MLHQQYTKHSHLYCDSTAFRLNLEREFKEGETFFLENISWTAFNEKVNKKCGSRYFIREEERFTLSPSVFSSM